MKHLIAIAARTASAAAAVALIANAAPAFADTAGARMLVDAVAARTTTVSSYTANISLHVAMHSFPFVRMTISGDTAYQQPGQYTLKMHTLPALARAFQNVSGDAGDPNEWVRKYDIAIDASDRQPNGNIALKMTPKTHGPIDHAEALIDTSTMTVTRMEWFYNNGGHIAVDYRYAQIGSVLMVEHQTAEIAMPSIRATATADLTNYAMQMDLASVTATPHKPAASQ
jgi:hypothetical protein